MPSDRCLSVYLSCLSCLSVTLVYCGQTVGSMDQDETWPACRTRPWPHCVRWGLSFPSIKRGWRPPPQFSAYFYCGQTAGWIKTAHGTEVDLSPGDIVLYGDPAPVQKGGGAPNNFRPMSILWPNGWFDQDTTWHGGRPRPRRHCVRLRPSSSH